MINSSYISLPILLLLFVFRIWPYPGHPRFFKQAVYISCLFVVISSSLFKAFIQEIEWASIDITSLIAKGTIPVWFMFLFFIKVKAHSKKKTSWYIASTTGTFCSLALMSDMNSFFLAYAISLENNPYVSVLLTSFIIHLSLTLGLGLTKLLLDDHKKIIWEYAFVFTFFFIVFLNIQLPTLTTLQNVFFSSIFPIYIISYMYTLSFFRHDNIVYLIMSLITYFIWPGILFFFLQIIV
jgi:hypothetical protein